MTHLIEVITVTALLYVGIITEKSTIFFNLIFFRIILGNKLPFPEINIYVQARSVLDIILSEIKLVKPENKIV